ncbi:DNA polymerase III subunit tau [Candidatus Moranella endobia PCVAL]|nr:DNA polymerase III subunit tau [Candidatus Moranella endobia PCVAL]
MSYHVLARKWRPKKISDVVGQEHVLTVITNSLSLGRLHHAYFLSGTSGVGKTTIARILAKGMNCATSITASPCGQCDNCREIEQGRFVDLIEIDAASRTKVEDTRELLDNVQYAPARGRFKIYLIDEVHMLSRHSFNALLNTLEEPPAHVKFLLATTEPQKVPLTILSRCLQFHLKALDIEQICIQLTKVLQLEQIAAEPRALSLLARAANGSMRDALSLTDQAIAMGQGEIRTEAIRLMLGKLTTEQPLAIIEALLDADGSGMLAQIAQYAARGMNWEGLLIDILSLLHRLAMWQILPNKFNDEEDHGILSRLITVASRLHPEDLQLYYQTLLIGRKELSFAPDPRMGVEMTLLRALAFHPATVEVFTSHPQGETNKFSADTSPGSTSLMVTPSSTTPLAANTDDDQVAVSLCSEPQKIAAGHACHTRIPPTPDDYYIRQNANGFNKAEIAIPENNSIAGVPPAAAQSLTFDHTALPVVGDISSPLAAAATVDKMVMQQPVHTAIDLNNTPDLSLAGDRPLLDTTTQLLHARTALLRSQEKKKYAPTQNNPLASKLSAN